LKSQNFKEEVLQRDHKVPAESRGSNNTTALVRVQPRMADLEAQGEEPYFTLRELNEFDIDELATFPELYGKSFPELEDAIDEYSGSHKYFKVAYRGGGLINLMYLPFSLRKSNVSIQGAADFVQKGATVDERIAYGVGGTISAASTAYWAFSFPWRKKALKATLDYIHRKPLFERLQLAAKTPGKSFLYFLDELILQGVNMTMMSTLFIGLPGFAEYHWLAKMAIVLPVQFFGYYFYDAYSNEPYRRNLSFLLARNQSSLIQEALKGNLTVPLQILIQGLMSTVALKSFPLAPQIAIEVAAALGAWIPPWLMIHMAVIYYLRISYRSTYLRYLGPTLEMRQMLRENLDQNLVNEIVTHRIRSLNLTHITAEKTQKMRKEAEQDLLKRDEQALKTEVLKEAGWGFAFKEKPVLIAPVMWRALAGGVFGYMTLPMLTLVGGGLLGAALFAGSYFLAERNVVIDELCVRHLKKRRQERQAEQKAQLPSAGPSANPSSCCTTLSADSLTMANSVSGAMTITGAGKELLSSGDPTVTASSSWLYPWFLVAAIENGFNSFIYGRQGTRDSFKSMCEPKQVKIVSVNGTLFNRPRLPEEKQANGLCCIANRR
jgi:hypothetical protein